MIVQVSTPDYCVEDLPKMADEGMKHIATHIAKAVAFLQANGAQHINIFWKALPPCAIDGTVGVFQIHGKID